MTGFDVLKPEKNDDLQLVTIHLNRPEKRNALNTELINCLDRELKRLADDEKIRAVFIRGNGSAFCAGADLSDIRAMQSADLSDNRRDSRRLRDRFVSLYNFPKPTAAIVHGPALAGGCGLATCCDFILAGREASFGYPEVKIGFVPAIVMVLLTHQIGERAARDLCLSGRTVGPDEALRMGLINQVVETDQLDAAALELAARLRKNSPQAMATVKQAFWRLHALSKADGLEWAADLNAIARGTDDCKEGIEAFLEKRKPKWAIGKVNSKG